MARIVKKSIGTRMCGIVAECLSHINQDALHFKEFTDDNGETVYVGAISDGCSGALGSENGSEFMVHAFVEEAGKLIKTSKRDGAFMRRVALNLVERMANYEPHRKDTEIKKVNDIEICEELTATLYAFVADSKNVLFMLAGDGSIAINDRHYGISQTGGDIYPEYILSIARKDWARELENVFLFAELPAERIRSFMIATDGFTHPIQSEYPGLMNDPAIYVLHAGYHATREGHGSDIPGSIPSRGGDDATALVFARPDILTRDLVDAQEVEELGMKVRDHFSKTFFNKICNAKSVIVRKSARKCSPKFDETFKRNLSHKDGVHFFGITAKDRTEYEKRQKQIIASRIVCDDPFAALFGKQSKPQPTRSSSKTTSPSSKKKPVDVVVVCKSVTPKTDKAVTVKVSANTVTPKTDQQPKKTKERAPKWRQFSDLCSIAKSRRTGIGFRQFGQVMYDLWHFVNNCHLQGIRIGNLRPWDILYKVNPAHNGSDGVKKPATYEFSLANPENSAEVEKGGKFIRNYSNLDIDFIHPEYFSKLSTDDQARLDQDWYAYSVLCYWFVTKFDPFGEGVVKAKPDADRIYRMKENFLSESLDIIIEAKKRVFIERALGRLSPDVFFFVNEFTKGKPIIQEPDFLINEFRNENVVTCDNEIFKGTKINHKVKCGFKQLDGYNICKYCGMEIKKLLATEF